MNLLLLEPEELDADGSAVVRGDRVRHLREVLAVEIGSSVRVGVIDGARGTARVVAVGADRIELKCTLQGAPPERQTIDLLLALPRPKVLSRLWAQLAALGVDRVMLTNAEKVERYYFDSHAIDPEMARPLLIEGLAQARDTRLPRVSVHKRLKILIEDELDAMVPSGRRLIADPAYPRSAWAALQSGPSDRALIALGPEGGWTAYERDLLERHGFTGMSLGPRTLRSDTAVVAILALAHEALNTGRAAKEP